VKRRRIIFDTEYKIGFSCRRIKVEGSSEIICNPAVMNISFSRYEKFSLLKNNNEKDFENCNNPMIRIKEMKIENVYEVKKIDFCLFL
jgi:hypothetical protein